METDTTLGTRLRMARKHAGFSQAAFAREASKLALAEGRKAIAQERISRYEHDRITPQTETIVHLANAAGVSVEWLLTGVGEGPGVEEVA